MFYPYEGYRSVTPLDAAKFQKMQKRSKLAKKNRKKRAGGQYLCTCGSNTRLKFQSKMIKNWSGHRGNAIITATGWFKYWIVFFVTSLHGWRTGQWNFISMFLLFVSLALSTPNFTLIGNTIIIRVWYIRTTKWAKVDAYAFSRISRRDRVGKKKV